jgi:hypothetical protein
VLSIVRKGTRGPDIYKKELMIIYVFMLVTRLHKLLLPVLSC